MRNRIRWLIPALLLVLGSAAWGIERFPPPDFESEYTFPETTAPGPTETFWEWFDVGVLLAALLLATYLVYKRRSRKGIFALMIFSLLYFGFWRMGCVCSIGAIGNVALTIGQPEYVVPAGVVLFFALPLIFALFVGRVFCAAVCPLGAIQDVVAIKPIRIPVWLESSIRMLAYVYLGVAVLLAYTGASLIICRYDPFIGFFRLSGSINLLIFGAAFLVLAMFVARPYCRFLCPYAILLRGLSRLAPRSVTVSPDQCVHCRLCEDSCPFGQIYQPNDWSQADARADKRRLALLIVLTPILTAGLAFAGATMNRVLARTHPTVRTAEMVATYEPGGSEPAASVQAAAQPQGSQPDQEQVRAAAQASAVNEIPDEIKAFRDTGQTREELFAQAREIRAEFRIGGAILGAFLGLVIGGKLIFHSIRWKYEEYNADAAGCVACGRCYASCPVGRAEGQIEFKNSQESKQAAG